jgi:hypothetical protein
MKKLVLSLCVLSLVVFGLSACSDASADSPSSSIETDVAALQAQVAALESSSAAQQTAIDTLQSAAVPKVYDSNDILLGRTVGADDLYVTVLTNTGKLFVTTWAEEYFDSALFFTAANCTGTPFVVDDVGFPSNYIFSYGGEYHVVIVNTPATSIIPVSYYHGDTCSSYSSTQTVQATVTITPAATGLPATIAYPLIIKD